MTNVMGERDVDAERRGGDGGRRWRRIVVPVISAVLIVAAVTGVFAMRRNGSGVASTVEASTPETSAATTTTSSTAPAPAPTTTPPRTPLTATVDLTAAVERLEPRQIGSYPIEPPGDLFPTAYATTAPGNRIAVLDDVTGVVHFVDGSTGMDVAHYPTGVPTIGSQSYIAQFFFVGPDDVLYVNEGGADVPALVAYGRAGDSYDEVARVSHGIGDGQLMLGRTGVQAMGVPDPIMPYVGIDGQPSGATLDVDELSLTSAEKDVYAVQRADRTWNVTYLFPIDAGLPPSDTCVLCASAYLGPRQTAVLINRSPTRDGDLTTKLTLLDDQITTYDTDWDYIGTLDGAMLFDRLDQDSLDLGIVEI